jgi:RNA polymerase sigma-70 factor (ECF subfamily)
MISAAMCQTTTSPDVRVGAPAEVDRDTIERCRAGDPIAFRAFVVRYERPVFALLFRILGPGAHIEDMAQETFLRAFQGLGGFDPDGAARPSTWLLTIATRIALNARKRRVLSTEPLNTTSTIPADTETPEKERARRELGKRIARAVFALPFEQRVAFILAEMHGFTCAEIARALEVAEGTAKTRVFRAREKMRITLADVWEDER